jgi:hypothetical protein
MKKRASNWMLDALCDLTGQDQSSDAGADKMPPRIPVNYPEIDPSLFWVPVSRVQQRRIYWVRMQGRKTWRKAHLEGRAWWIGDKLLGRLVDSAEIRKPIERVLAAIVSVADTMAATIEDPEPGIWQYRVDRDVVDWGNQLIDFPDSSEQDSAQLLAIYRLLRFAAATLQAEPLMLDEIVVGYCVVDRRGNRVFESVDLDTSWHYANDRKGRWLDRVAAVLADGTVKIGHEATQRPWLTWLRRKELGQLPEL